MAVVVFSGADSERGDEGEIAFERSLSVDECRASGALLAWGMNGEHLPPQHGAPIRLIVRGWYGIASVKWLVRLAVLGKPFSSSVQSMSGFALGRMARA